ncbi:deoxyribonuclease V [Pseudoxanthomonas daejeonensis]|uniref:Endonuclease V n=1 Tax=Pseudoxanthomonas daejeonensis TaxID=266062 RepID=A0ABQ6Z8X1_9GAMM|nr:deoxyribonuclease V [Pseudoxanthomonas daejeonensis]KAF1695930.1 deoxyribonuclease V [Pseudoxanthomonas daejeonensis]UNK57635.1 deoxyribonuclease V [Pseudoxanthomonas daejeonensis]
MVAPSSTHGFEAFPGWDGSVAGARTLQAQLAAQVVLEDVFPRPLRTVAGFDVGFEDQGDITRAAVVLLDAESLQTLESHVARLPTAMPYVPGLLSFRELPALLLALEMLSQPPDLAMVDGQGIAHPRRLGIAAHFGVATGLPSLGVAKSVLVGDFDAPGPARGDRSPITHRGELVGFALRSKLRCNPLIVSPGHRVSLTTAAELVVRFLAGYRLPEPTRLADRLASRREAGRSSTLPR